jgi:hypothetical protein
VPKKFVEGLVPLLPVSDQALALTTAEGVTHDRFPEASVCNSPAARLVVGVRLAGSV